MVRSSSACFKIIACGSDSADTDELERTESKGSADKRGWSFRKRSARHRVLSNTVSVSSELPSTVNKESCETNNADLHVQSNPTISEKNSLPQWKEEAPPFSSQSPDPKESDGLPSIEKPNNIENTINIKNPINIYSDIPESIVVVIQTAIRSDLAQRTVYKLKNVVKIQAAVRGHLVRKHAVGTLRCVQAIVKMQALVRARRARQSTETMPMDKENFVNEAHKASDSSNEKLLTNGFARQLLEAKPKAKPMHIKCDRSKPNSAWQWLERWMAAYSKNTTQTEKTPLNPEDLKEVENVELSLLEGSEAIPEFVDVKSDNADAEKSVEILEEPIAHSAYEFNFQPYPTTIASFATSVQDDTKDPRHDNAEQISTQDFTANNGKILVEATDSVSTQSNITAQVSLGSETDKPDTEKERPKSEVDWEKSKRTIKRAAPEQLENEGKKFGFGTRKPISPAFAAVQSKFEELSANSSSTRSISSSHDVRMEPQFDSPSSQAESVTSVAKTKEYGFIEDSVVNDSRVQTAASECGTELSVTSTLDSPDRLEVESSIPAPEILDSDKVSPDPNASFDQKLDLLNHDNEVKKPSPLTEAFASSFGVLPEKRDEACGDSADLAPHAESSVEEMQSLEPTASDLQIQLESIRDQPLDKSSPDGSPRSHITFPDSQQGTPSSQVSANTKRSKSDSKPKRKTYLVGTRSPSNPNHDSGARSSTDNVQKDLKNGKRRNSLDHESRVGSGNNSLPSYMQATESARAKINSHQSPKSSPDVHDKEIYIKKRHSLPTTNGKQGSPRMQRSMSQAQQNAKGNGTHSPHTERKWQR